MNIRTTLRIMVLAAAPGLFMGVVGCESAKKQFATVPTYVLLEKGDHALYYGNDQEAADYFQQVLDREPGNGHALRQYGECMLAIGEPVKAVNAFSTAALASPEDADLVYLLAKAEVESGSYDRAFDLLRIRAIDNADSTAWMLLAEYALQLDDPDTAETAIRRAIELIGDTSPRPYLLAADLQERLGNEQEALRRLRQAYGRASANPEVDRRLREYGELPGPSISLPPGA